MEGARRGFKVDFMKEGLRTAQLIYPSNTTKGEFRKAMNGQLFTDYVEKGLIPAFKAQFNGKRIILVMDNAPYHRPPMEVALAHTL